VITGVFGLWQFLPSGPLWAQTLDDLESQLNVGGEPALSLFTVLVLAAILLGVAIMFLVVRSAEGSPDRAPAAEGGERESYIMHVAFLATGYAAIIIMLTQLPPFMTPGLGSLETNARCRRC
jgi:hypothetical protein